MRETNPPAPILEGEPPKQYQDVANEILQRANPDKQLDITVILALASALWSLYQACQRRAAVDAIKRARAHPHGLVAIRVRARILGRLPKEYQTDEMWHATLEVLGALVDNPKDLPPDEDSNPNRV